MNLSSIRHETGSIFSYPLSKTELYLCVRAAKGDLKGVRLYYFQRYDGTDFYENIPKYEQCAEMKLASTDHLYDYYEIVIKSNNCGVIYFFEPYDEGTSCFYGHYRFMNSKPKSDLDFFMFNSLPEKDVMNVPAWSLGAVVYQVFTSSFNKGNLEGVVEKLSHIKDLGADIIYFTPIFESSSDHKYDTVNYYEISKSFGSNRIFKKLVKKAHSMGLKIVLDAVFNHSGFDFPPFKDAAKKGVKSKFWDWFDIESLPLKTDFKPNYTSFGNYSHMPKLMTKNDKVRSYLLNVASYWIKKYDIDGWRVDCANEIDQHFHRCLRNAVKDAKNDSLLIAEIWHEAGEWLKGDQYDGTMNYQFYRALDELITEESVLPEVFLDRISFISQRYKHNALLASWNMIGSHDTSRFLTRQNGSIRRFKAGIVLQFMLPGSPFIYYGDEIGMEGGADPDNRRKFNWDISTWNHDILAFYKRLINLRKKYPALRYGKFSRITPVKSKDITAFSRFLGDEQIDIYINTSFQERSLHVAHGKLITDIIDAEVTDGDGGISVKLKPHGFAIFERK